MSISQLAGTIVNFTNPFLYEGKDLFNIATKVVMPDKVKQDLCNQSTIGSQMLKSFTEARVKTTNSSIWSPMKKRKLCTWKSVNKVIKVKTEDKVINLREHQSLFARMALVAN